MSSPLAAPPVEPDWQAVALDYRQRILTVDEICQLHGISLSSFYKQARQEGWPRRQQYTQLSSRKAVRVENNMTKRLLLALDMKMTELEKRMATNTEPPTAADCERNARTLNTLVGLFEKLKKQAVSDKMANTTSACADGEELASRDGDELRSELMERLQRLNRGAGLMTEDGSPRGSAETFAST